MVGWLPSLAHHYSNCRNKGGPAALQDSPPAPILQPRPQEATPSHWPPCQKKAPRPDSTAAGPASFPKVSPPPHDTCPAPAAGKAHRLPPHPFSVTPVSGDAGLPARKRPAPGIPPAVADTEGSPTTSTARHPIASPLKVCRFINRQHGGFHAQANARSSSSARRGPSGNSCPSGYRVGAS